MRFAHILAQPSGSDHDMPPDESLRVPLGSLLLLLWVQWAPFTTVSPVSSFWSSDEKTSSTRTKNRYTQGPETGQIGAALGPWHGRDALSVSC